MSEDRCFDLIDRLTTLQARGAGSEFTAISGDQQRVFVQAAITELEAFTHFQRVHAQTSGAAGGASIAATWDILNPDTKADWTPPTNGSPAPTTTRT